MQRAGTWRKSAIVTRSPPTCAGERAHLAGAEARKALEQAELVHHLERRGMEGVAAEVAQEVGVLLEHGDLDAGAREQQAEHHADPELAAASDLKLPNR